MLATKVLASGITHLTDARYFAAWEVSYLAFPLTGAAGITWEYLNALREWVEGPTIVAELPAGIDAADWARVLQEQKVDHALVPHLAPAAAPQTLHDAGITVLTHLPVAGYQSASDIAEALDEHASVSHVVLDFQHGGITWGDLAAGHPFGLAELETLLQKRSCLLQIDLGGQDPKTIKAAYALTGYAVRGSSEEKVGYKSFDDLDDLFEGLEVFE